MHGDELTAFRFFSYNLWRPKSMTDNFQLTTVDKAAPKFEMSKQGLYRAIRENQFPYPHAIIKVGKQIRINLSLIEKTMEQHSEAQVPQPAAT
jgi:hypothetical protein